MPHQNRTANTSLCHWLYVAKTRLPCKKKLSLRNSVKVRPKTADKVLLCHKILCLICTVTITTNWGQFCRVVRFEVVRLWNHCLKLWICTRFEILFIKIGSAIYFVALFNKLLWEPRKVIFNQYGEKLTVIPLLPNFYVGSLHRRNQLCQPLLLR